MFNLSYSLKVQLELPSAELQTSALVSHFLPYAEDPSYPGVFTMEGNSLVAQSSVDHLAGLVSAGQATISELLGDLSEVEGEAGLIFGYQHASAYFLLLTTGHETRLLRQMPEGRIQLVALDGGGPLHITWDDQSLTVRAGTQAQTLPVVVPQGGFGIAIHGRAVFTRLAVGAVHLELEESVPAFLSAQALDQTHAEWLGQAKTILGEKFDRCVQQLALPPQSLPLPQVASATTGAVVFLASNGDIYGFWQGAPPPGKPILGATLAEPGSVRWEWQVPSGGPVTGFRLWRGSQQLVDLSPETTSFTETTVPGRLLDLIVEAIGPGGETRSEPASFFVPGQPGDLPLTFAGEIVDAQTIRWHWELPSTDGQWWEIRTLNDEATSPRLAPTTTEWVETGLTHNPIERVLVFADSQNQLHYGYARVDLPVREGPPKILLFRGEAISSTEVQWSFQVAGEVKSLLMCDQSGVMITSLDPLATSFVDQGLFPGEVVSRILVAEGPQGRVYQGASVALPAAPRVGAGVLDESDPLIDGLDPAYRSGIGRPGDLEVQELAIDQDAHEYTIRAAWLVPQVQTLPGHPGGQFRVRSVAEGMSSYPVPSASAEIVLTYNTATYEPLKVSARFPDGHEETQEFPVSLAQVGVFRSVFSSMLWPLKDGVDLQTVTFTVELPSDQQWEVNTPTTFTGPGEVIAREIPRVIRKSVIVHAGEDCRIDLRPDLGADLDHFYSCQLEVLADPVVEAIWPTGETISGLFVKGYLAPFHVHIKEEERQLRRLTSSWQTRVLPMTQIEEPPIVEGFVPPEGFLTLEQPVFSLEIEADFPVTYRFRGSMNQQSSLLPEVVEFFSPSTTRNEISFVPGSWVSQTITLAPGEEKTIELTLARPDGARGLVIADPGVIVKPVHEKGDGFSLTVARDRRLDPWQVKLTPGYFFFHGEERYLFAHPKTVTLTPDQEGRYFLAETPIPGTPLLVSVGSEFLSYLPSLDPQAPSLQIVEEFAECDRDGEEGVLYLADQGIDPEKLIVDTPTGPIGSIRLRNNVVYFPFVPGPYTIRYERHHVFTLGEEDGRLFLLVWNTPDQIQVTYETGNTIELTGDWNPGFAGKTGFLFLEREASLPARVWLHPVPGTEHLIQGLVEDAWGNPLAGYPVVWENATPLTQSTNLHGEVWAEVCGPRPVRIRATAGSVSAEMEVEPENMSEELFLRLDLPEVLPPRSRSSGVLQIYDHHGVPVAGVYVRFVGDADFWVEQTPAVGFFTDANGRIEFSLSPRSPGDLTLTFSAGKANLTRTVAVQDEIERVIPVAGGTMENLQPTVGGWTQSNKSRAGIWISDPLPLDPDQENRWLVRAEPRITITNLANLRPYWMQFGYGPTWQVEGFPSWRSEGLTLTPAEVGWQLRGTGRLVAPAFFTSHEFCLALAGQGVTITLGEAVIPLTGDLLLWTRAGRLYQGAEAQDLGEFVYGTELALTLQGEALLSRARFARLAEGVKRYTGNGDTVTWNSLGETHTLTLTEEQLALGTGEAFALFLPQGGYFLPTRDDLEWDHAEIAGPGSVVGTCIRHLNSLLDVTWAFVPANPAGARFGHPARPTSTDKALQVRVILGGFVPANSVSPAMIGMEPPEITLSAVDLIWA